MKRVPQGRYSREFRQEAVRLVTEKKLSLPEAGRRLALLEGQRPSSCLSVLQEPGHEIGAYSIRVRPFHMRWAGVSR